MYSTFFGFKERPFQLVPNPAYLFLSKGHEEALAHLAYAISHGDGFVAITGEVGTGKTTLCRVFLDGLDNTTEAAYVFNPKLDAVQLLKAINDEFGIDSGAETGKELIDTLNHFLMAKKAAGSKVLLLIDEAQNLSLDVLEQLRLLSNLETNTAKLLQIILVGQPELTDKLGSHELRQLEQRITLRCHLPPMNFRETKAYILHRLHIGSPNPVTTFTNPALRRIYNYSRGIPRLINICCDRALLTAFGDGRNKITLRTANTAIRELKSRARAGLPVATRPWTKALLPGTAGLVLLLLVFMQPNWFKGQQHKLEIAADPTLSHSEEADLSQAPPLLAVGETPRRTDEKQRIVPENIQRTVFPDLNELLKSVSGRTSRHSAMRTLLTHWHHDDDISTDLEAIDDNATFFRLTGQQNGMNIYRVKGGLDEIEKLDLPAILAVYPSDDPTPRYLCLYGVENTLVRLQLGTQEIALPRTALEPYWDGTATIFWKNFIGLNGIIPLNSSGDAILSLKMLIRQGGVHDLAMSPIYDQQTKSAVIAIQDRHGLETDGLVGPATKIVMYNDNRELFIPHIINNPEHNKLSGEAHEQRPLQLRGQKIPPQAAEAPGKNQTENKRG